MRNDNLTMFIRWVSVPALLIATLVYWKFAYIGEQSVLKEVKHQAIDEHPIVKIVSESGSLQNDFQIQDRFENAVLKNDLDEVKNILVNDPPSNPRMLYTTIGNALSEENLPVLKIFLLHGTKECPQWQSSKETMFDLAQRTGDTELMKILRIRHCTQSMYDDYGPLYKALMLRNENDAIQMVSSGAVIEDRFRRELALKVSLESSTITSHLLANGWFSDPLERSRLHVLAKITISGDMDLLREFYEKFPEDFNGKNSNASPMMLAAIKNFKGKERLRVVEVLVTLISDVSNLKYNGSQLTRQVSKENDSELEELLEQHEFISRSASIVIPKNQMPLYKSTPMRSRVDPAQERKTGAEISKKQKAVGCLGC